MFLFKFSVIVSALFSCAIAKTIRIDVGAKNTLAFSPNSTEAASGDILEFHFYAGNHSVVRGPFETPCSVAGLNNLAYSGFIPTSGPGPNAQIFSVEVTSTFPMWFYCAQTTGAHCAKGMVMVVNEPHELFSRKLRKLPKPKTLKAYASKAAKVSNDHVTIPASGKAQFGTFSKAGNGSAPAPNKPSASPKSAGSTANLPLDTLAVGVVAFAAFALGSVL